MPDLLFMEPWKNALLSKVKFYIDKGDTELVSSIAQYFSIEIHVFGWLVRLITSYFKS